MPGKSQLPFGWVCFSNIPGNFYFLIFLSSQLPFGWVCFSNRRRAGKAPRCGSKSQLPFGWVCFSNCLAGSKEVGQKNMSLNCLSAGSVSLTAAERRKLRRAGRTGLNCLSAGSVSLTLKTRQRKNMNTKPVSIAFRLGLFL